MVFGNLRAAFQISGVLYVFYSLAIFGMAMFMPVGPEDVGNPLAALALTLVSVFLILWLVVAWHRYILLDDLSGALLPALRFDRMLAYFGKSLIVLLLVLPIFIALGVLVFALHAALPPLVLSLVPLAALVGTLIVFARLGPLLPSAAVGQSMTVREAWAATSKGSGTIVGLAILVVIMGILLGIPASILSMQGQWQLALAWSFVADWVALMVGITTLTTVYGHYVEGRTVV